METKVEHDMDTAGLIRLFIGMITNIGGLACIVLVHGTSNRFQKDVGKQVGPYV